MYRIDHYVDWLIPIGKYFFVIGMMAIGIEHFVYEDFIIGRAPEWPEHFPGKVVWAYASGLFFVSGGILILINKHVRTITMVGAFLIFSWAFLRRVPMVLSDSLLAPSWTSAGKAIVFVGALLVLASSYVKTKARQRDLLITGRICLSIFLLITGLQHFIYVDFVASLIPGWFPGNGIFWTYFAGVALICGGLGLLIPRTARLAAILSGVMIFSWFWIVHIPRATASISDSIAVFEALAFSGLAFLLTQTEHPPRKR